MLPKIQRAEQEMLARRSELLLAQLRVATIQLSKLTASVDRLSSSVEVLTERNTELELDNRALNVEAELHEQQLATLMDMCAERNRYTEHLGSMDPSRITNAADILDALIREARELTHEYATSDSVMREERQEVLELSEH